MAKRFARLRGALMAKSIDQTYLAEKMKCSLWYVNQRMCGHQELDAGRHLFPDGLARHSTRSNAPVFPS